MHMTHEMCRKYFNALFRYIPDDKHDMVIESIELLTKAIEQTNKSNEKLAISCCNKNV